MGKKQTKGVLITDEGRWQETFRNAENQDKNFWNKLISLWDIPLYPTQNNSINILGFILQQGKDISKDTSYLGVWHHYM